MNSIEKFAEWARAAAPEYQAAAQALDVDEPMLRRALRIVRAFIASRRLVLYGGIAIDYALRSVGAEGIYDDTARPDYDFYSPDNVGDAYDLADILRGEFDDVNAIRAIHVQTMRVRIGPVTVADIGYLPRRIFDGLPFLESAFDGPPVRFVHPRFQSADLHLAFCFPLANPPMEDIFHRGEKDSKRFGLLASHPEFSEPRTPQTPWPTRTFSLPAAAREHCVLHGYAVLAALEGTLEITPDGASGNMTIVFPAPTQQLDVASHEADRDVFGGVTSRFRPLIDHVPRVDVCGDVRVHSTRNRLLALSNLTVGGFRVASAQYALLYLITRQNFVVPSDAGEAKDAHREAYARLLALVRAAEPGDPAALSVTTYGDANRSEAYLIRVERVYSALRNGGVPTPDDVPNAAEMAALPKNYYAPPRPPPYDYRSHHFALDGGAI